jgi:hypothetical protein
MLRAIAAAVLGYVFIGALIFGTDQVWAHVIPGFTETTKAPPTYFAVSMLTDTIYSAIGGWLCAMIALGDKRSTWALIIIGELAGVASTVYLWNTVPHWYSFFLLIAYPPAIWYGAKFRKSA